MEMGATEGFMKYQIEKLEEENKKLKRQIDDWKDKYSRLDRIAGENVITLDVMNADIIELKEENEELKETIKELNNYNKFRIQENERLKSDLGECECSFGFESDEVGFWKREYKRLKKWIKDHCKGYGNLFPEDEMKRQWKKADKKRK